MSTTTYLFLDTRHSNNPQTPATATWNLNMRFGEYARTHIALEQVSFANTRYPVNENNNTLVYEENDASSTTTSTLDVNSYTGTQLATELQTQLNADTQESTTYTVTYSSQSKKLTIAGTNNFRILNTSTCLEVIGVDEVNGMTSAQTSFTPSNVVRLDGTDYIDVVSNLSLRNVNTDGRTNTMGRIYVTSPFGELNSYQNFSDTNALAFYSDELSTLDIRLIDASGNTYTLGSNTNVSYTLKLIIG